MITEISYTIVPSGERRPASKGEVVIVLPIEPSGHRWIFHGCAKCCREARLSEHNAMIETDFTMTIHPSIVCPFEGCGAHYFIERSKVRVA